MEASSEPEDDADENQDESGPDAGPAGVPAKRRKCSSTASELEVVALSDEEVLSGEEGRATVSYDPEELACVAAGPSTLTMDGEAGDVVEDSQAGALADEAPGSLAQDCPMESTDSIVFAPWEVLQDAMAAPPNSPTGSKGPIVIRKASEAKESSGREVPGPVHVIFLIEQIASLHKEEKAHACTHYIM